METSHLSPNKCATKHNYFSKILFLLIVYYRSVEKLFMQFLRKELFGQIERIELIKARENLRCTKILPKTAY